ncbi:MAG TPA: HEAT repeat domain-containing protein [Planctomycetota bacterium]|nr:HEAT repeat domain-containing protein [Planctomycetota bacterium]
MTNAFRVLIIGTAAVAAHAEELVRLEPEPELRIQLSPDAKKKADNTERVDLYYKMHSGDEKARKKWVKLKPAERTRALADVALAKEESAERRKAIKELGQLSPSEDPDAEGVAALAKLAVADSDGGIRALSRKAIAARDDERVLAPLATALKHKDALVRGNAAAAMRELGGPRIFEVIIEHWKETWGPGPRAHCFFGQMRSYVADYDISGDAYDPVVRSFMTGVVLDVKSLRVEGDIYYITIREVAPDDVKLPNNPAAWKEWLDKERDKIAEDGRKKRMRALSDLTADAVE